MRVQLNFLLVENQGRQQGVERLYYREVFMRFVFVVSFNSLLLIWVKDDNIGIQWAEYYSVPPHTRVYKNTRIRAHTLVGNNFSVSPYPMGT